MTVQLDETTTLNKLWNKKSILPLLQPDKREATLKRIHELGIKRITALDTLGEDFNDWNCTKELTLVILPINNKIEQTGTNTKDRLKELGMTCREKYLPIDILDVTIETEKNDTINYYPQRNLIIAKINPFYDERGLQEIIANIAELEPKFLTQEQIWDKRLARQWEMNYNRRETNLLNTIEDREQRLQDMQHSYRNMLREIREAKESLDGLKIGKKDIIQHIKEEITKLRKVPFIKGIEITDEIKIDFGDTYITTKVHTGNTEATGARPAEKVYTNEKVYIGPLRFIIKNDGVRIINPRKVERYEHPHAVEGRPCFGNSDLAVQQYLQSVELVKLAHHLFAWSRSYSLDGGPHTRIETFYRARKAEEAKKDENKQE